MKKLILSLLFSSSLFSFNTVNAQQSSPIEVSFAGIVQGEIEKDSLFNYDHLEINNKKYSIESFVMSIQANGVLTEIKVNDNTLSDEMKSKYFENLRSKDKIYFEHIKATDAGGISYELKPVSLRIK
jgi:hypothetical protein